MTFIPKQVLKTLLSQKQMRAPKGTEFCMRPCSAKTSGDHEGPAGQKLAVQAHSFAESCVHSLRQRIPPVE